MKKTVIILTIALVIVFASSGAWAGPWGGKFYGRGPMISNLTPEQSSKVLALQLAHQEKIAPIQEQLFKKKTELRTMWLSQTPDQNKINAVQKEIFELVDVMQQESAKLRADILKVIAPAEVK